MGEILPAKVRGLAASIATAFNWLCVFVVTKTFTDIRGEVINFSAIHFLSILIKTIESDLWKSRCHLVFWLYVYPEYFLLNSICA